MLNVLPVRARGLLKELAWVTLALLAVTGVFAIIENPTNAPSWQIMVGLFLGTVLRWALKSDDRDVPTQS